MRVLILNFATLKKDPRVFRQVDYFLSRGHQVTCLWHQEYPGGALEQIKLPHVAERRRKMFHFPLKLFSRYYWSQEQVRFALQALEYKEFDLIVANDAETLPLAERVKRKATLLFDAHEFAPAEWEEFAKWRLLIRPYVLWCLKALKSVDLMTTICAGIQGEYKKSYGIDSEVITNACRYFDLAPKPVQEPIRMIYTGIAHPGRHIDQAVRILKMLDQRFHLDMILVPGMEKVIAEIKELAKDEPRIRFLEPVPLEEIVPFCNRYDIGFFPLIPTNRNVHHGLGNKFFEFIQARLCLALSPLQEMARLTKQYDCGVVAQDFSDEAFASMLNALSSGEIQRKKENASQAAFALSLDANWAALDRFLESCDVAAQIASK